MYIYINCKKDPINVLYLHQQQHFVAPIYTMNTNRIEQPVQYIGVLII